MAVKLKPLAEQVIVITGGSSGIGLATVRAAARKGAKVVFAARGEDALEQVARSLQAEGCDATHVVADVSREEDVERLAAAAIDRHGRIDTWVNDAGVDVWGRLTDVPLEDSRRVFDVNFWGLVHGSLAAVKHMRMSGGALINVGSVAGDRSFPLQGMYCATKHAVKAFTDALRMELEEEGLQISVTLIKPSSVGTPLQRQAKNYLDKEPRLPSPLYSPEEVAYAILHAAETPVRDVYVGSAGRILAALGQLAPRLGDLTGERLLFAAQESDRPARPRRDNLHEPSPMGGVVRDDVEGRGMRRSVYTRASLHPWTTTALFALAGVGIASAVTGLSGRANGQRRGQHEAGGRPM